MKWEDQRRWRICKCLVSSCSVVKIGWPPVTTPILLELQTTNQRTTWKNTCSRFQACLRLGDVGRLCFFSLLWFGGRDLESFPALGYRSRVLSWDPWANMMRHLEPSKHDAVFNVPLPHHDLQLRWGPWHLRGKRFSSSSLKQGKIVRNTQLKN